MLRVLLGLQQKPCCVLRIFNDVRCNLGATLRRITRLRGEVAYRWKRKDNFSHYMLKGLKYDQEA